MGWIAAELRGSDGSAGCSSLGTLAGGQRVILTLGVVDVEGLALPADVRVESVAPDGLVARLHAANARLLIVDGRLAGRVVVEVQGAAINAGCPVLVVWPAGTPDVVPPWCDLALTAPGPAALGAAVHTLLRLAPASTAPASNADDGRILPALAAIEEAVLDFRVGGELHATPALLALHGFAPDEVAAYRDSWSASIHPDDREATLGALRAHLRGDSPAYEVEYRKRLRDGTWRWMRERGRVVARDEGGRPLRLLCMHHDVTARREAEALVREREERFQLLASAIGDVVWIADGRAGRVLYCSPAFETVWGRPVTALYADTSVWISGIHPDDRARVLAAVQHIRVAGVFEAEYRVMRPDGSIRWIHDRGFRAGRTQDDRWLIGGISTDVTERRATEAALRESQQRLRLALAAADVALGTWDIQRDEVMWVEPTASTLRLPTEPLQCAWTSIRQLIHPDDHGVIMAALERALAEGVEPRAEFRMRWPDGWERWVEARGNVSRGDDGRPAVATGVLVDVTDRKAAERERERLLTVARAAQAQAEDASAAKDRFLATLSHELRSPLGAMLGWLHVLRRRGDDPEQRAHGLTVLERSVRAQTKLIDDLLDISRITAGRLWLDRGPVDLVGLVATAVQAAQPSAEARGVRVAGPGECEPLVVHGDPRRLEQVLANLVDNAVKFTETGGVVTVGAEHRGTDAVVVVRDTGVGIDPRLLPRVFDRFERGEHAGEPALPGLGLGLAIVRHLVEAHGGRVHLESDGPGTGTAAVVSLPVVTAPGRTTAPAGTARRETRAPDAGQAARVLVVEDLDEAREALVLALRDAGLVVDEAATVPDALRCLDAMPPDVVVSDIGLPGEDGYALVRALRDRDAVRGRRTPAIALTGFASADDVSRAHDAGFDVHLAKPVRLDFLISLLHERASRPALAD